MKELVRFRDVHKIYPVGQEGVHALDNINFAIAEGEYVAIMGPSGSGKSTLLNLLGCLDRPTSGQYILGGDDVAQLSDDEISAIRGLKIGFVFQSFNLIPRLTVLANIEVPLFYQGVPRARRHSISQTLATQVGLGDRIHHKPTELSGGQQQRVAMARALVNNPLLLLADEPTGNLDSRTSDEILGLFDKLWEGGATIIMVTHEVNVVARARRIIRLRDGRIDSDEPVARAEETP